MFDILEKEKKQAEKASLLEGEEMQEVDKMESTNIEVEGTEVSQDLKSIKHEESNHFTVRRVVYTLICFFALFFTSKYYGSKRAPSPLPDWGRWSVLAAFAVFTLLITIWAVRDTVRTHEIKERDGYNFVASDMVFSKV